MTNPKNYEDLIDEDGLETVTLSGVQSNAATSDLPPFKNRNKEVKKEQNNSSRRSSKREIVLDNQELSDETAIYFKRWCPHK